MLRGTPAVTASLRRSVRSAAALGIVVSMTVAATPALAAGHPVSSHVTARVSPGSVPAGGSVVVSGSVTPRDKGLTVRVQRLEGHTWKTVGHGTESRTGGYSIRVAAPAVTGTVSFRAVRPATKNVKSAVSRTVRLRVTPSAYHVTARVTETPVPSGSPIVIAGRVSPTANGTVTLQQLVGTTWTTLTSEGLVASAYTFLLREPPGTYTLRVVKPRTAHHLQGVSPSVTGTVFATTNPPQPPAALAVTTARLPTGTTHRPYTAALSASGGSAPYTWELTGGTLPPGLTLSAAGLLSGTPTDAAAGNLTVQVTDSTGSTATAVLGLTVALAQGSVLTWGDNANGELGDGLPLGSVTPSSVPGLSGVKQVASHGKTAYALTTAGAVESWGAGAIGQLGNGNDVASATPVPVTGLSSGVVAVAAGSQNGYALKSDGAVWAWGVGTDGELGNAGQAASRTPVKVSSLTSVKAIAAEDTAGLALKTDGTVWRWGQEYPFVGHGGGDNHHYVPALVPGLSDQAVIAIAGGAQSGLAVMADKTVRTWGLSVGDGATPVAHLAGIVAVAAGSSTAYALDSNGAVYAWGEGGRGQLGNGATSSSTDPVQVSLQGAALAIAANGDSAYAVMADHTVWAWGANNAGQLGDGNTLDRDNPVQVLDLAGVTGVAGSGVARHSDGTVSSWGPDLLAYESRNTPAAVAGITDATSLAEDDMGGTVIRADGSVWDWGDNLHGELGNGSIAPNSDLPVQVTGLNQVIAIAGRAGTRYALKADGTVWAWGANNAGVFGSTSPAQSSTPIHVAGIDSVTAITAATDTVFALRADGSVWAWGYNGLGSLGDGGTVNRATPAPIAGLSHITSVVAARWSIYAITDDGHVWGWGDGFEQQLDPAHPDGSLVPVLLSNISGVRSMATTGGTAYAVLTDGSVVWWGFNPFSVADATLPSYQAIPQPVPGAVGATQVAATDFGGAALLSSGTVVTWGTNRPGYRGWDSFTWTMAATPVAGLTGVTALWAGGEETGVLRTG
jgi:alpha-tubulin suppressor-like RCC1 family protein